MTLYTRRNHPGYLFAPDPAGNLALTVGTDGSYLFRTPVTPPPGPPGGPKMGVLDPVPVGKQQTFGKVFADYGSMAAVGADFYFWQANPASSSPWTIWDPAMWRLDLVKRLLLGHAQAEGQNVRTCGLGRKRGYTGEVVTKVHCRRPAVPGLKRNGGIWWPTDGNAPQEPELDDAEDDGTGTGFDMNVHLGSGWPSLVFSKHAVCDTTKWGVLSMEQSPTGTTTIWTPDDGTAPVSLTYSNPSLPVTSHNLDVQIEALGPSIALPAGGVDFEWDWWQELVPA